MISIGPTQKSVRKQIKYFEDRSDYYNAMEAAKGLTDESEYTLVVMILKLNEATWTTTP
jgi:hypothetical protein